MSNVTITLRLRRTRFAAPKCFDDGLLRNCKSYPVTHMMSNRVTQTAKIKSPTMLAYCFEPRGYRPPSFCRTLLKCSEVCGQDCSIACHDAGEVAEYIIVGIA